METIRRSDASTIANMAISGKSVSLTLARLKRNNILILKITSLELPLPRNSTFRNITALFYDSNNTEINDNYTILCIENNNNEYLL